MAVILPLTVSACAASPYRGVFLDRTHGVSKAAITVNGKREYLGTFASAEEGARAGNAKARELDGDFAYRDDVPEGDQSPNAVEGPAAAAGSAEGPEEEKSRR